MEFRTKVAIEKSGLFIGYGDGIVMLGSCFTENIGARLSCRLMDVCVNPFGTLYNPASIADAVERLAENRMFTAGELFEYGGRWHSFAHHSRFSSADREKALERINSSYAEAVVERVQRHFGLNFKAVSSYREILYELAVECAVSGHDVAQVSAKDFVE